jgi:hypothetical protein
MFRTVSFDHEVFRGRDTGSRDCAELLWSPYNRGLGKDGKTLRRARPAKGDPASSATAGGAPCGWVDLPLGRTRYMIAYGYPWPCIGPHIGIPPGIAGCMGWIDVLAFRCSRPKITTACIASETLSCKETTCQESRNIRRMCAHCGGENTFESKPGSSYLSITCTGMPCPFPEFCQ